MQDADSDRATPMTRGAPRRVATRGGEETRDRTGNPRAKETKPAIGKGQMGSRSSALMLPMKPGNRPEGPGGGKRGVGRRNC